MTKIYFAASIRGGRDNSSVYDFIVNELRTYGKVLTEHIISKTTTHLGSTGDSRSIYSQDIRWLHQADVLIAEVTQPSFGVGYEIAHAEHVGKTVLCLYRPSPNKSLSAMIAGSPFCRVQEYKNEAEIEQILADYFKELV
jgi:2'-deoxynucleoside 5'-phosphate N-hydrolase